MAGRERIAVAANDTLERVLEQLRSTDSADVVLEVDERSPLLISLQQLHSLDEVAQAHGVQVAIASANSKLLNAARVFGLEVIDARAQPPPTVVEPARLLAGQPLGQRDQDESDESDEEGYDDPPLQGDRVQDSRVFRRIAAQTPPPPADLADDEAAGWEEPLPRAEEYLSAPIPAGSHARQPRHDPYGQPYLDDDEDEEIAPTRGGRTIRSRRPATPYADATAGDDTEGWDDESADNRDYADGRGGGRPGRGGIAGFWGDVRAWIEARRGNADPVYESDPDEPGPEPVADEEGWEEPPYRERHTARAAHPPTEEFAEDDADDEVADEFHPERQPRPIGRIAAPAGRERTARLPVVTSAIAYGAEDGDEYAEAADDEGWQRRRELGGAGRFALGSLLFTLLIVGTLLAVALYLLLPTATVTLAARTGQVSTEFRVVVGEIDPSSPQGQPTSARIVVPAKRITVPLNATATRPATGARLEPDVTAGGSVVFTNPSTTAVAVPKGTALEATDGRGYVTMEGVTIGPADPFDSGAFGSATVKVAASIRGAGGNAAIGAVRGQLASGVYYTNKTAPIAGGSDRRIPTISPQDRAAARAAAEDAARGKGSAAIGGAVPAGGTIMHDTTGVGGYKVQFNAAEGADGDSVTATVTAEATALVYSPGEVEAQARAEAERRLAALAKPGEPIVAGSVQIGAPQLVEDVPGQLTYAITGGAQTRAALGSDTERERLAQELAHKDDADARDVLAAIPGVASSAIKYETGPFPERMPWLASHIRVQITEAR